MISPDAIAFSTRGHHETRFEHTERTATLARSRLRTYLVLKAKAADVRIKVPAAAGRKLQRALTESGIKVIERAS